MPNTGFRRGLFVVSVHRLESIPVGQSYSMSEGLSARCLSSISRMAKPRRSCRYSSCSLAAKCQSQRAFATNPYDERSEVNTRPPLSSEAEETNSPPRWKATPPRMKAPFRSKPPPFKPNEFVVNDDPALLDKVYVEVLGESGDKVLTDEVKWLAVTHKSFDHGRRGYNDRLAFLGTMNSVFMQNRH